MKAEILTRSGKKFDILNPKPEMINIEDIAIALSMQCRFNGHINSFYSVAEHSVRVSYLCPDHPLEALLHDAAEAYIGDMVSPLKKFMPEFQSIEQRLHEVIAHVFNISPVIPDQVHQADKKMLDIEMAYLQPFFLKGAGEWYHPEADRIIDAIRYDGSYIEACAKHLQDPVISGWGHLDAFANFLARFNELQNERGDYGK